MAQDVAGEDDRSSRPAAARHTSVMLDEVVDLLAPALREPGSVFVDGTLGMAGHSEALLRRCPEAHLVGIDRDTQALALAGRRLAPFAGRTDLVHAVDDEIPAVLDHLGLDRVQAVLLDLGVSSLQLDEVDRGFSYAHDAPLDMRMDPTAGPTAADVLNTYSEAELARVLTEWGEERYARRIARRIVALRAEAPLTTSARLVDAIRDAVPAPRPGRPGVRVGHPAKRTFQALRIEVNQELTGLEQALPAVIDRLAVGGRIAVLAFHSLEDRLVKRELARGATSRTPPGLPVERPEDRPYLKLLTHGALRPGEAELEANPRSASVRLRAAERIRAT